MTWWSCLSSIAWARPHMDHKLHFIVVRVRYTCEVPVRGLKRHDLQTHVSMSHRRHRRYWPHCRFYWNNRRNMPEMVRTTPQFLSFLIWVCYGSVKGLWLRTAPTLIPVWMLKSPPRATTWACQQNRERPTLCLISASRTSSPWMTKTR